MPLYRIARPTNPAVAETLGTFLQADAAVDPREISQAGLGTQVVLIVLN